MRTKPTLVEGKSCWRIARANRATAIIDAADYFRFARAAMLSAQRRIMLVGWDFDARIEVERSAGDNGPAQIGDFLTWLVDNNPGLDVYLLRWDMGALKSIFHLQTLRTILTWWLKRRIHPRLDAHHPTGASHHQKLIVIDDDIAFVGGIDMTVGRWDTREHRDNDPGRILPDGKLAGPWHDAAWVVDGPAAAALGELCRMRWRSSGGRKLSPVTDSSGGWPAFIPVDFADVDLAISRTMPELPGHAAVLEIETLYLNQIRAARDYLYIESQYFASRRIAEAIARRMEEKDPPEIVVIEPLASEGWLQSAAMDSARARIVETLRRLDKNRRARMYHPFTKGGEPIYVHSKLLIADDRMLRIGSSNLNNRSMRLDTECDVTLETDVVEYQQRIRAIRDGLLAEHLGVDTETIVAAIAEHGGMIGAIEALRGTGKTLQPYVTPDLSNVEKWLADNEVLDPDGPGEMFESLSNRGLFRGKLGVLRDRFRNRKSFRVTHLPFDDS